MKIVTFEGAQIDSSTLKLEVPLDASVLSASVDVSPIKYKDQFATDVTFNVGNDEDYEWEFKGLGYGSYGDQNLLTTGEDKKYLFFPGASSLSADVMLPRNASIKNTALTLEGGTGNYNELYFACIDYRGTKLSFIKRNSTYFDPPSLMDSNTFSYYCYAPTGIADFNNDGELDLVSGAGSTGNVFYYEKKGPGNNFKPKVNVGTISTSWYMYDMATGDFNNDGNYDFVTSGNTATLYMFLGNGKGAFTMTALAFQGGPSYYYGKDAADINNDGNLDLVCGGYTATTPRNVVYYFQGLGNGNFNNPVSITVTGLYQYYYAMQVITDDFDEDGNVDILTSYYDAYYYFMGGNGDGTFNNATYSGVDPGYYGGGDAWDYDGDGHVDLIVINGAYEYPPTYMGSEAFFYEGTGKGTFVNKTSLGFVGYYCYGGAAPPPKVKGAKDASLLVGGVGPTDWSHTGRLEGVQAHVADFSTKLNGLLKNPTYKRYTDKYGNEFVIIPLNFSSTDTGLLRIQKLSIEYDYTATIRQVGTGTLADELNQHIKYTGGDTVTLHIIVSSSSAGKLKFTNLNIVYNIPPDQAKNIPTLYAYEDVPNLNLLNLSSYFTDVDEPSWNLNYSVVSNSASQHIQVFTNYSSTLKFLPVTEHWNGEAEIVVQAKDAGSKRVLSNKFKIIVQPVNDEPRARYMIDDVEILEGQEGYEINLGLREYFTDVENDDLYYKVGVDPLALMDDKDKEIAVEIDSDNILRISGIDDFNTFTYGSDYPVPVWVYCDDDAAVNTEKDGTGNFTYQELSVTVQSVNDAPGWTAKPVYLQTLIPVELKKGIPTITLYEDDVETFEGFLNLYDFVEDDETADSALRLSISSSNPKMLIGERDGYLNVTVPANYYGSTRIKVKATDEHNSRSEMDFDLIIAPVNDAPTIQILSHSDGEMVNKTETIAGNVSDVESTVRLVEVKIESQIGTEEYDWQEAELDKEKYLWSYTWLTSLVQDGPYKLTARVYDGELTTESEILLQVDNDQNRRPEVEIISPLEKEEVNSTVIISGGVYDPELAGISELEIKIGADSDWEKVPLASEDATLWSYTWNSREIPDGVILISVKALDNDGMWSIPKHRTIKVSNGINATDIGGAKVVEESSDNMAMILILALVAVVVVIGVLIIAALVTRANKKVREYVPDGRIESMEELEHAMRLELGPSPVAHAPLPAAPATVAPAASRLPPAGGVAPAPMPGAPTSATPVVGTLPSARASPAAGVGVGAGAGVPALPAAGGTASAGTSASAGLGVDGGYGLYRPGSAISAAQPALPSTGPGQGRYATAAPAANAVQPRQPQQ